MTRSIFFVTLISLSLFSGAVTLFPHTHSAVAADNGSTPENWKDDFTSIIAATMVLDSLSSEEIKQLVARCDELRPKLERLEETPRKVYTKRLDMAKNLFLFVLDNRSTGKKSSP